LCLEMGWHWSCDRFLYSRWFSILCTYFTWQWSRYQWNYWYHNFYVNIVTLIFIDSQNLFHQHYRPLEFIANHVSDR